ncbi:hypothetical protein PC117_g6374 [Phytophthora cactorum]|uniref:Uncharacterized protein n=2 Tax=Phytophthora cactorum TaxID=29920 RepID=A0A8T1E9L2_9STRA|nr:hypothetical protein PC117_g6374 [Phytophthora cactorum]
MSRAEWNKRLMRTKKGDDGSQLVPEGCDLYQRVYICTHGWKKRKSRSEGSRPKQHIRLTDCPFRFVAQCNLGRGELQVKHGCFMHNHVVSPSAYATYPTFRGVENALVEARTEGMLAVGAKRSRIYDYLLEHDQNVIQVDVDNMPQDQQIQLSTSYVYGYERIWWTNPARELKKVRLFTYVKFERHGPRKDQLSLRTHAERYREAIRATHVIASELVNIGDESELNEMLTFVSNQWRNGFNELKSKTKNGHPITMKVRNQGPKAKRIFTNQAPYFNAANAIDTHLKISAYKTVAFTRAKRERLTDSRLGASSIILKDFGLDASARRTELEQANGNRRHSSDQKLSTTHLDGQGTTRIDRGWVVLLGARM